MIDAALRANPRVIVTIGHDLAIETRKHERNIPIVSAGSEDPVANGRDILAHGDHLEIHQRADRVVRVGRGRAQLLTLLL